MNHLSWLASSKTIAGSFESLVSLESLANIGKRIFYRLFLVILLLVTANELVEEIHRE